MAAFLVQVLISIVLSVAQRIIAQTLASDTPAQSVRGYQVNTTDTQVLVPVVYGHHRVGVNYVDMGLKGNDNKYLHMIGVMCEGEINGIVQKSGVDQIFINDKIYTDYTGYFTYKFYSGSATQGICTDYSNVNLDWDSALRYTAYLYCRLTYNADMFQNRPELNIEIEGLKVYNPATAVTEYSNNPALCIRDFMTRSSRRGGMGIAAARIDDDFIIAAAAYCTAKGWTCDIVLYDDKPAIEHLRDLLSSMRGNLILSGSKYKLTYQDLDYESPVMDITEDDIVQNNGRSSLTITQPSIFDTPNAVKMTFYNAEKDYLADEYVFADSDAIAADGDYREKEITLPATTGLSNVQKMANYFLEKLRVNKTADMIIGSKGMALEPLDLIRLTHSRPGWTNKIMRVQQPAISQNGEVGLQVTEEDAIFYDDIYNVVEHDFHDTTLPSPSAAVSGVINVIQTEEQYYYRERNFTRWKIDFDPPLETEYPWFDHADIWIKIGDAGTWRFMTTATTDFTLDPVEEGETYYCRIVAVSIWGSKQAVADAIIISKKIAGYSAVPDNVTGFTAMAHGDSVTLRANKLSTPDIVGYEVRMGAAWDGGLPIAFNETPNFRLSGIRPSPTSAPHTFWIKAKNNAGIYSATAASVQVTVFYPANYSDKNTWAWDFATFVISTITFTFAAGTTVTASADCIAQGVAVGMMIYNSSDDDASDAKLITDISSDGLTITLDEAYAGTAGAGKTGTAIPGTFINAEHESYSGEDALKCSHTAGVLTGTWLSPVYDLGSVKTVRVWGDFRIDLSSGATTWKALLPAATPWKNVLVKGKPWYELLQPAQAGQLSATLKWGTTTALGNESDGLELFSMEISARYVQIFVTIIDPNSGTNVHLKELNMVAAYWQ